jgi:hypothetical protein
VLDRRTAGAVEEDVKTSFAGASRGVRPSSSSMCVLKETFAAFRACCWCSKVAKVSAGSALTNSQKLRSTDYFYMALQRIVTFQNAYKPKESRPLRV